MNKFVAIIAVLCCSQAQAGWRWNARTCRYYWVATPVVKTYAAPTYNTTSYTYHVNNSYIPQAQGATQYGLSSLTQVYANSDIGSLYQQASLLARDAQAYGAQAVAGTQALATNISAGQYRVAEAVAVGEAVREAFRAARPANSATVYTQQQQGYASAQGGYQTQGYQTQPQHFGQVNVAAIEQNCQRCHSRQAAPTQAIGADGNPVFLPPLFKDLSPRQAEFVQLRIGSHDPSRVMPQGSAPLKEEEQYAVNRILNQIICRPAQQPQYYQPQQQQYDPQPQQPGPAPEPPQQPPAQPAPPVQGPDGTSRRNTISGLFSR